MAFTFTNYPILTPEQQSPWQGALSRALDTYAKTTKASYMPRQMEAELFSKEISPLAALASSPNFTGFNPEIQKMIAQRIGSYLGHGQAGGGGAEGQGGGETPGYAGDEDIYSRLKQGSDIALSRGGKSRVGGSRLAGEAEKFGFPKAIVKALGGTEAADQNAAFEQAMEEGVKRLTLKGYSAQDAKKMLQPKPGETNQAYNARIKPLFIEKQAAIEEEEPIRSIDQKEARDEQERADAEATAAAFNTTPEKVMEARSLGIKSAKEFRQFLNDPEWGGRNG